MKREAQELLAVARALTAATKDLAEVRAIIPEMRQKQRDYEIVQEQQLRERNLMWHEATKNLDLKTTELLVLIEAELVRYFNSTGMGVRKHDVTGGLLEVFIGSNDGVKRYQSKVSAQISLTFEGREKATFMLRNEELDDVTGNLSDRTTVRKLLTVVNKAFKKGFWKQGEM